MFAQERRLLRDCGESGRISWSRVEPEADVFPLDLSMLELVTVILLEPSMATEADKVVEYPLLNHSILDEV